MTTHRYTTGIENLPLIEAALLRIGFVEDQQGAADLRKSAATTYGQALRQGPVRAVLLALRDREPAVTLSGSDLVPVMKLLGEMRVPGRPHASIRSLLKSEQQQRDEAQAARLARARKAQAEVLARQAERERQRIKHQADWRLRSADAGQVETRLAAAGYQLASGTDGLPIWTFGTEVEIAIRSDQQATGSMAEITLRARSAAAFASAKRLITATQPIWPINRAQVTAQPAQQLNKSQQKAKKSRREREALDVLLDASNENLARALRQLPKARREALHQSLAKK
jgi:hypothetical protein